jgi:hypothetical protein
VIAKLGPGEGIVPLDDERVRALELTPAGRLAAEAMLADQQLLRDHDLAPSLNCVYDCVRDPDAGTVPTDVTSFHVDSAPVEVDTWLCTYHGACSEGLRNEDALLKVEIPEIRAALLERIRRRGRRRLRRVPARTQLRLALRAEARRDALPLRHLRALAHRDSLARQRGAALHPPCPGEPSRLTAVAAD